MNKITSMGVLLIKKYGEKLLIMKSYYQVTLLPTDD